jgi:hypothetical protein
VTSSAYIRICCDSNHGDLHDPNCDPEPIKPHLRVRDYHVKTCSLASATALISAHHYARGAANTAVFRHGLYRGDAMVGAALWMPPTKVAAASVSEDWQGVICLSRLVVIPGEPTNAASFLLGRSIRAIRRDGRYHTLLTYADESMGHTGVIYRATNWTYVGRTKGDPAYVDAVGRQVARKCAGRSRTHTEMLELGYICRGRAPKHKFVLRLRKSSGLAVDPQEKVRSNT